MLFLGPRPQGQGIFSDFMILLDLSYDPGENEVLLAKIGARVLDLRLVCLLVPSGPNVVYRLQNARSSYFLKFHDFIGIL